MVGEDTHVSRLCGDVDLNDILAGEEGLFKFGVSLERRGRARRRGEVYLVRENKREAELVGGDLSVATASKDGGHSPCNSGKGAEGGHFAELVKEFREVTVCLFRPMPRTDLRENSLHPSSKRPQLHTSDK